MRFSAILKESNAINQNFSNFFQKTLDKRITECYNAKARKKLRYRSSEEYTIGKTDKIEVRRLTRDFLDCLCQKSEGVLYVRRAFAATTGGKRSVKMRAASAISFSEKMEDLTCRPLWQRQRPSSVNGT